MDDANARVVLLDRRDRAGDTDVSEAGGQPRRQRLGAAADAALLRPACRGYEHVDQAAGLDIEQPVQQRGLARLGADDRGDQCAPEPEALRRRAALDEPGVGRLPVKRLGTGRGPRRVEDDTLGEFLRCSLDRADVLQDVSREPERRVRESQLPAVELENALAVIVGREQREAELVRERAHAMLCRTDPLAAELHHRAVGEGVVEQPPADAIPRLEHHDGLTRRLEVTCSRQPGQASAHYDDIELIHVVLPRLYSGVFPTLLPRCAARLRNEGRSNCATIPLLANSRTASPPW